MKKILLLLAMLLAFSVMLASCKRGEEAPSVGGEVGGVTDDTSNDDGNDEPDAPEECNHNWSIVTTEPKCTEGGVTLKVCSICGQGVRENETSPLGHSYEYNFDESYHWRQCIRCDRTIDKFSHSFTSGSSCDVCGYAIVGDVYSQGLEFTLSRDGSYYILSGLGTCTDSHIIIPKEYNSLPVKEIDYDAFMDYSSNMPDYCQGLCEGEPIEPDESIVRIKSVTFFENIVSVGDEPPAFVYLFGLESINAVNNNYYESVDGVLYTKDMKTLVSYPAGKTGESFVIPESVETIGIGAIYFATELKEITIPSSVSYIGYASFVGCVSLRSISIPEGVTSIGEGTFMGCRSLVSIDIPVSVTGISDSVFDYCCSLSDVYYGGSRLEWNDMLIGDYNNDALLNATIHYAGGDFAYSEGLEFTSNGDGTCYVSGMGTCSDTALVIPPISPAGDAVTAIGIDAFIFSNSIVSLSVPYSVVEIRRGAFYGCSSLSEVILPEGLTIIGASSFAECRSLASIVIPGTVSVIDEYAFQCCESLNSVNIPESVTTLSSGVFECTALTTIEIPNSVTVIESNVFWGCTSLEYLVIPDSVTSLGALFVSGCESLTFISIGRGVNTISENSFTICKSLVEISVSDDNQHFMDIDGNLYTKDGTSLLQYAIGKGETTFTVPYGVLRIGHMAFWGCQSLVSVTLSDDVFYIGSYAFYGCEALTYITIPKMVLRIANNAFELCSSLSIVYYLGSELEWDSIDIDVANENLTNANIIFAETIGSYSEGLEFTSNGDGTCYVSGIGTCTDTDIVIPLTSPVGDTVLGIGQNAFYDCDTIRSVYISNGIKRIGDQAFYNCDLLTDVFIPKSVENIGDYCFRLCVSITDISVAEGNLHYKDIDGNLYTKDGKTLIRYASGKEDAEFVIPYGVIYVEDWAFAYCDALTRVTISDGVIDVGECAFWGVTLQTVVIARTVTNIGKSALGFTLISIVCYSGSVDEWNNITIGADNDILGEATILYNY